MKKNWLQNGLSLLLVGGMLLSALPVGAAGTGVDDETTQFPAGEKPPIVVEPSDDETPLIPFFPSNSGTSDAKVLYSWAASDRNRDLKAFSSNLPDDSDPNQRWNEVAWIYTAKERKAVNIHSFLNEADASCGLKTVKDAAGRTAVENLQVDVYPMAQISSDIGAVSLSFVLAYKPELQELNPANSGLLQVYASANGVSWSKDYVTVRSAQIVGSGVDQDGKSIIYYEIVTEDLKAIAKGDVSILRILPDGNSGMCSGSFSLCTLTLNGYKTQAAFQKAVPAEQDGAKADRTAVLNAYRNASGTGLQRLQSALSLVSQSEVASVPEMLNTMGVRFANGIAVKATADVRQLFDWMVERKLRTWSNLQPILDEYENITNTEKLIKDLNRPQQIFKAYATCDVGDLLVQVKKDGTSNVYMMAKKVNAQPDKAGNINIATSTVTYVDGAGNLHSDDSLFTLYTQGFVPMVMDALADNTVQPVRVDTHVSGAEQQVRVAVSAGVGIHKINYTVKNTAALGTVSMDSSKESVVFTSNNLNQLPLGTYEMQLDVYTLLQPETPVTQTIKFDVLAPTRTVTVGAVSGGKVAVSAGSGALGSTATVTAIPDPGYALQEIRVDGTPISGNTFVIEQDHVVTAVFKQVIIGLTTTLGNSLSVDFMIDTSKLTGTDNYAQITKHYADGRASVTVQVPQAQWKLYSEKTPDYYYASFTGVCAKEMSDSFDVEIFSGSGKSLTTGKTDSLCEYAMRMLARADVIGNAKLRTVYVDMLNYGAEAQVEFKYNTGKLANRLLSATQQGYASAAVEAQDIAEKSGWIVGTALTLEHQILMDFVIADSMVDSYEGMHAVATYTDHYGNTKQIQISEIGRYNASYHQVSVAGMAVADFRQPVTLVLYNASGVEVGRSTDSVESYVARMSNRIGALGQAILKFGQSSYNYFH